MTEVDRVLDQLRRAWRGPAWHGPAVMEALARVTPARATARPLPNAHSIWEITDHIAVWEDVVRRRIRGEAYDPSPEEDWRPMGDGSDAAWSATLARLEDGHRGLEQAIEALDEARLLGVGPGSPHTPYVLIHGAIQHDLYHAGQIVILAK
jgi:uncharacterized damage-inducible protein DinB